jgi:hypothetical protein
MGRYYYFYVESYTSGGWTVPKNFQGDAYHPPLGEFTWLSSRSAQKDLFWGETRLFEMRRELPPERANSAFFRRLDSYDYDYEVDEQQISWLPYTELQIDAWDEPLLILERHAPARYARLFGDGQQLFPRQQLLDAGYDEENSEALLYFASAGRLSQQSIDRTQGKYRHQLEQLPSDAPVLVTWTTTISDFLHEFRANAFKSLRQYASDEDLRIITSLS